MDRYVCPLKTKPSIWEMSQYYASSTRDVAAKLQWENFETYATYNGMIPSERENANNTTDRGRGA